MMELANTYSTKAEHCRQMAEKALTSSEKEDWLKLAADWTAMAADFASNPIERSAELDPVSGALPWKIDS